MLSQGFRGGTERRHGRNPGLCSCPMSANAQPHSRGHARHETSAVVWAGASALAVLALTAAHHLYGAWRFDTPWRAHVAHVALLSAIAMAACLGTARAASSRALGSWAVNAFVGLVLLICGIWLGLYEGGYNHGIKNLAHAAGLPDELLRRFFPAGLYEPPGDLVFELSGVLQLPAGLLAARAALAMRPAPTTSYPPLA